MLTSTVDYRIEKLHWPDNVPVNEYSRYRTSYRCFPGRCHRFTLRCSQYRGHVIIFRPSSIAPLKQENVRKDLFHLTRPVRRLVLFDLDHASLVTNVAPMANTTRERS